MASSSRRAPRTTGSWNPETGLLPVADLEGQRVADSHKILDVLDERWPEPPLTSADPKLAAAQRNLEQWASETFLFYWERYLRQRMQEIEDGAPERAEGALARFGILRRRSGPGAADRALRGGVRPADRRPRQLPRRAPVLLRRPHQPRRSRGLLVPAHRTLGSVPESNAAVTAHRGLVDWLDRVAEETRGADV